MSKYKEEDLIQILKDHNLKVTDHRLLILNKISKSKTAIAAHKLIEEVKKKAEIDQATVYRNLTTLEESGVISRYDYNHGHAHYEISNNEPKHQIICSNCETVENVSANLFDDAIKKLARKSKKFKEVDVSTFQIYGLCKSCA